MTMQASQSEPYTHSLSVMIPCKDNARTIGRVLESVRGLATQLVVVDSGSTDETIDLVNACRSWTGTDACEVVLIETHWRGYVKTKQLALDACSHDYTLWLDSDEPVSDELASSVRKAIADGIDAAEMVRMVEYKGKLLKHCWQPEHRLRLVRTELVQTGRARFNGIDPHDFLEIDPPSKAVLIPGVLVHDSFETFAQHLENQRRLSLTSAKSMHAMGNRTNPWKIMTSPIGAFMKQILLKGAWRDGYAGWLCAGTSAAGALMKHMMLYEMGQER
jgi:GTP:adenosylcobinamide-phosphate guanylyltransferase